MGRGLGEGDYSTEKESTSVHKKEWQTRDKLLPTKRAEERIRNQCRDGDRPKQINVVWLSQ